MMDRRAFIGTLSLGGLAAPRNAHAQAPRRVARIGVLSFAGSLDEISGAEPRRPSLKNLFAGLRDLGYVYGRDFITVPFAGVIAVRASRGPRSN